MRLIIFALLVIRLSMFSFNSPKEETKISNSLLKIKIKWVDNLEGNFEFRHLWSYPEGIYKNRFGQLSCDGLCPMRIDAMKDKNGRIYDDSLTSFYQLIDTSHQYFTLNSQAQMYEWAGTNFVHFTNWKDGEVTGQSLNNIATHSSLYFKIKNDSCIAKVNFNSITDRGRYTFYLGGGHVKIDRNLWQKDTIKSSFNLIFINTLDPNYPLYWKGKIYSPIQSD